MSEVDRTVSLGAEVEVLQVLTEPERLTPEQKARFFLNFMADNVFTDRHLGPDQDKNDILMVFMPLAFLPMTEEFAEKVGVVWELMEKASDGVEGRPLFKSCNIMHKEDWEELRPKLAAEVARRNAQAKAITEGG